MSCKSCGELAAVTLRLFSRGFGEGFFQALFSCRSATAANILKPEGVQGSIFITGGMIDVFEKSTANRGCKGCEGGGGLGERPNLAVIPLATSE